MHAMQRSPFSRSAHVITPNSRETTYDAVHSPSRERSNVGYLITSKKSRNMQQVRWRLGSMIAPWWLSGLPRRGADGRSLIVAARLYLRPNGRPLPRVILFFFSTMFFTLGRISLPVRRECSTSCDGFGATLSVVWTQEYSFSYRNGGYDAFVGRKLLCGVSELFFL